MPTRDEDLERRIEAAQEAREGRDLSARELDGRAADEVWR